MNSLESKRNDNYVGKFSSVSMRISYITTGFDVLRTWLFDTRSSAADWQSHVVAGVSDCDRQVRNEALVSVAVQRFTGAILKRN